MIEVKNVVKSFDGFRALDGLTMTVPPPAGAASSPPETASTPGA